MSAMTRRRKTRSDFDAELPDPEIWDAPGRLTDDDLFAQDGPGWRRTRPFHDEMEDDR